MVYHLRGNVLQRHLFTEMVCGLWRPTIQLKGDVKIAWRDLIGGVHSELHRGRKPGSAAIGPRTPAAKGIRPFRTAGAFIPSSIASPKPRNHKSSLIAPS